MSHSISSEDFTYTWSPIDVASIPSGYFGNLSAPGGYTGVIVPVLDVQDVEFENKITTMITFPTPINIVLEFGDIDYLDRFTVSVSSGSFIAEKMWGVAPITISDTGPTTSSSFTAENYQYDGVFPDDMAGNGSLYEGVRVTFTGVTEITAVFDSNQVGSADTGGAILFLAAIPEPSSPLLCTLGFAFLARRRRS